MINIVQTFLNLTSIPSPSGNEEEIQKYIIKELKKYTSSIFTDSVGNLFLTIPGTTKKPLLLCAHMDTVNPTGKQQPIIKNDIIYSNGNYVLGADNKTSVAAIIETVKLLKAENLPHPNLELLFTVQEETTGGIQQFPKEKIKAKHCIMSDLSAPIGDVLIAAPFVAGYGIMVSTTGSHVKRFTKETFHPLQYFLAFNKKIPFGRISEDTIVNIGITRMGENYNNIPNSVYFTGEIRTFSNRKYQSFLKKLQETVDNLDSTFHTKADFQLFPYCEGFQLSQKDLALIKKTMEKLDIKFKPITGFGVGDENTLAKWGIKTINFGDGSVNCHTLNEHIAIKDLTNLLNILKEYVTTYS